MASNRARASDPPAPNPEPSVRASDPRAFVPEPRAFVPEPRASVPEPRASEVRASEVWAFEVWAALRVWGAWAIVAGLIQLAVAVRRRGLGGQWPMIASGAVSVLAGTAFITMASADPPTLGGPAGYAVLGGIFFLVSAVRLTASTARRR